MTEPWEGIPTAVGCQLWGVIGRLLTDKEITDNELNAIKRRFYGFQGILIARGYQYSDINILQSPIEIKGVINELEPVDIAFMFH